MGKHSLYYLNGAQYILSMTSIYYTPITESTGIDITMPFALLFIPHFSLILRMILSLSSTDVRIITISFSSCTLSPQNPITSSFSIRRLFITVPPLAPTVFCSFHYITAESSVYNCCYQCVFYFCQQDYSNFFVFDI